MVWLIPIVLALVTGVLPTPRWTVLTGPLVSLGLGVAAVVGEPEDYDMHGFGYYVAAVVAAICVVAWFLGRGAANLVRRRS